MHFALLLLLGAAVIGCGASTTPAAPSHPEPDADTIRDATSGATPDATGQGPRADAALNPIRDGSPAEVTLACAPVSRPGRGGVFDVTTYGARADGSDAYTGIQAAVDAACAKATNRPPVFLPIGRFAISRPLLISCNGLELYGACRSGSVLVPQFAGPAVLLNPPGDVIKLKLGPALVGTGQSMDTEAGHFFVNLRDIPTVELDGLTAFTAEAFVKQTAPYAPGWAGIVGGPNGCQAGAMVVPCGSAFRLGVAIQNLGAYLTVGGTPYALNGPALALNVVHHVALTYDSAMIRLFLDGAIVASKTASGPVKQSPFEDVTIGPSYYPLETSIVNGALPGFIDSVRLSNVARYTSPFPVPTAKLASDANTLALTNFDAQFPGLTRAINKDGPFWLPIRRDRDAAGNSLAFSGDVTLHNFTVAGGMGIFGWLATVTRIYQVDCLGCDYGFAMMGNNYLGQFDDVTATAAPGRARFGIYTHTANGNGWHNVRLSGQTLPLVKAGGAEQIHTNLTITAGPSTVYAATLLESDDAFNGLTIDATGAGPAWRGAIAVLQPWAKLLLQRGTIGNAGNGIPITVDGMAGVLVEGTSFTGTQGAAQIIHVATATAQPNIVIAATKDSNVPWSDDANLLSPAGPDPAVLPNPATLPTTTPGPSVVLGGVPESQIIDVTTYGAKSDGSDSSSAIQAAIDAGCARAPGSVVFFPVGEFWLRQPALVHCNGLTLEGAARGVSTIRAFGRSPALILNPPGMTGVDLAPALVGSGNAMKANGTSMWLELRDTPFAELDGVPTFTAEAFINLTAASKGYGGIVQSHGCLGTGPSLPGCTSAFALGTSNQSLTGSISVGATSYALQGPAISLGAVHHVALSYDGVAIRLFLDGAVVAMQMASGALTQGQYEDVTLGPRTLGFDGAVDAPAMAGVIDSVRLSSTGRYNATFAPPAAKLTIDAGTLLAVNFDDNRAGATHALGRGGESLWLPVRRTAEPDGAAEPSLTGITLRSLAVGASGGVFGMNVVGGRYVDFSSVYADQSLVLDGKSGGSTFDGLMLLAGGRGRLGLVTVNGDGSVYHNVRINYAKIPLAVYGGSGQEFTHIFLTPDPATSVYGAYFLNAGVTIEGLYFDNEGLMPLAKGDIVAAGLLTPFTLLKGEIDVSPGTIPITIDGGKGIVLAGTSFGFSSKSPELVHVSAPTAGPRIAIGITADSAARLSDDPGFVSIGR